MSSKPIPLESNLRRLYGWVLLASILTTASLFLVLTYGNKRQAFREARANLQSILEAQIPYLMQDFVNDRFYAAVMRGKDLSDEHKEEGLQVGLYRSDGTVIYESPGFERRSQTDYSKSYGENGAAVFVSKKLDFAGEPIGSVVFAKKVDLASQAILQTSLSLALGILLTFLCLLFFLSRMSLEKSVLIPIQTITSVIPKIENYLNGQEQNLALPTSVGSLELDQILTALFDVSVRLREALTLKQEAELKAARRMISERISRQVAHDIRSPLAALNLAIQELQSLPEDRRILIRQSVQRISDISNNLVASYKIASGDINEDQVLTESISTELLSAHIESVLSEKRAQLRSNLKIHINFQLNTADYGLFSNVQPIELKRVISNLVNNSVEAIPECGLINVGLKRIIDTLIPDAVEIWIEDNGKGIPDDLLERIGTDGTTFGKAFGQGLGLSHAKTTIQRWGGRLSVTSSIGKGTRVSIIIPRSKPPAWFAPELLIPTPGRVIVVDDDESIHRIWEERLRRLNDKIDIYHLSNVDEFSNWIAAQGSADKSLPDLFLMDFEFLNDSQNGLELIEKYGIAGKSILVTSRYDEPGVLEKCLALNLKVIPKGIAGFVPILDSFEKDNRQTKIP